MKHCEKYHRPHLKKDVDRMEWVQRTAMKMIKGTETKPYEETLRDLGMFKDGHTHQWTVYVKPYRNEDMSAYVKKIQFKLHESYSNPLRVVTKPPYEITETGWGEFEIIIKIFFIDPNERPVTLYHLLKLFQSDTNAILGKKTVVSEFYDEMIFQDPTAMMQQLLTTSRQLTLGAYKHETEFADVEVKTREKLEAAKKKTSFEIAELKERLKASHETINCLKNEIRKLEDDDQSKEI
ncbi:LOW QUALITY PROTEIN: YEATS domain-containing protein 4-like [Sphaerodactylus townsendi]|uniref:LOW QUALITY PROTEIN: YEATS domain-containing protein 4-like n=1 Tax=Sphaerodactylus townsendi TaxID=933632 RepID=UPI002025F3CF|nr:LOW QUALITY PROTEIN: YEATS domain-containing protein 4-like [Sphaerodactylus townsendi]